MNEGTNQLGGLTVSEILEAALGSDRAGQILQEIQAAIDNEQLKGDALKKRIFELLCKYSVEDIEVFHILYKSAKQVVT
jgi:hypothetical protein